MGCGCVLDLGQGPSLELCEYGNELLGLIKGGKFSGEASDCQLSEKNSALRS